MIWMTRVGSLVTLGLSAMVFGSCSQESEEQVSAASALNASLAAILRADGVTARQKLIEPPLGAYSDKQRTLKECIESRLNLVVEAGELVPNRAVPATSDEILERFRSYWRESVADPAKRDAAEVSLRRDLANMIGQPDKARDKDLLKIVQAHVEEFGEFALIGRTGLLLDILLWSDQTVREEHVELPEGAVTTKVFYLDEFRSQGWGNYLTCDHAGTGGWATKEGLYAIVPLYKSLTDEAFRVSYLAHESQHYSDYARFPDLTSWELEYRAKLVELIYADTTLKALIAKFSSHQGSSPDDAHSYANQRLISDLQTDLNASDVSQVPNVKIQETARALLIEHSRQLASR